MTAPFTSRITSPALSPALSAGPPSSTWLMSAPRGRESLNESASAWFTSWIVTPMRPRCTRPLATSWSLTFIATSIGIANETPW